MYAVEYYLAIKQNEVPVCSTTLKTSCNRKETSHTSPYKQKEDYQIPKSWDGQIGSNYKQMQSLFWSDENVFELDHCGF